MAPAAHRDRQHAVGKRDDRDFAAVGGNRWVDFTLEEQFERGTNLAVIAPRLRRFSNRRSSGVEVGSDLGSDLGPKALPRRRMNFGDRDRRVGNDHGRDFVEHEETPCLAPGKEGVIDFFRMYRAALPDLRMVPDDILASGDKVVIRLRAIGTNEGEFMGMPATGRSIDKQTIDITRFGDDGLAHEHWGVVDSMTMMQQLGLVPDAPPS